MNILTFDIEEWYIEKIFKGDNPEKYRIYDELLERVLDLLDKHSTKATFFCLGSLVEFFPSVVQNISNRGHEIGCHSNSHKWVNKMSDLEFIEDTRRAIDQLEQCCGKKVRSYRAPAFSICEKNKNVLGILSELGIENDASIFPGSRDFGGFPTFPGGNKPCRIDCNGVSLNEFPISMTKVPLIGKNIAYSGGGYFRLLPYNYVRHIINSSEYVMCYFHILDLMDIKSPLMTKEEYEKYFKSKGRIDKRVIRYFKSNIGRKRTFAGLEKLLNEFDFLSVEEAAQNMEAFPKITI